MRACAPRIDALHDQALNYGRWRAVVEKVFVQLDSRVRLHGHGVWQRQTLHLALGEARNIVELGKVGFLQPREHQLFDSLHLKNRCCPVRTPACWPAVTGDRCCKGLCEMRVDRVILSKWNPARLAVA